MGLERAFLLGRLPLEGGLQRVRIKSGHYDSGPAFVGRERSSEDTCPGPEKGACCCSKKENFYSRTLFCLFLFNVWILFF